MDGQKARRLLEVNLLGTYYIGVHALHRMKQRGAGTLLNVTSGTQAGMPPGAAYCASKAEWQMIEIQYVWEHW